MFSRIESIDRLSDEEGHDPRSTLLRVVTDMFVESPSGLTLSDLERYADLALPLLDVADTPTRLSVAARLCAFADTPARVMERLLLDSDPQVVDEVIRRSCQISRQELLSLCLQGRDRHVVAVARRHDLDAAMVRVMAQHENMDVVSTLLGNNNAPLDSDVTRLLVSRAASHPVLAELLLRRTDVPCLWLAALYAQGDNNARARLRDKVGEESGQPELPIPVNSFEALHKAAVKRDKEGLSLALARMLRLDPAGMEAIFNEKSGELLAMALVAAGCEPSSIADVMRFAAIRNDDQSIEKAMEIAMGTSRKSARRIVSAVADERLSPASLYEPHMAPGGVQVRNTNTYPTCSFRPVVHKTNPQKHAKPSK
jgi:uncharacterized protein (DUF2336 family)